MKTGRTRIAVGVLYACLFLGLFSISCGASLAEKKRLAEASRGLGEGYLSEGDSTAALKELLKAEELYQEDHLLQNDLGLTYFAKEQYEPAIDHFKKALALKPDFSEAQNNLGTVYLELGRWDDAIACFIHAKDDLLYMTPHFAMRNLGEAYRGKGDYERAILWYKKALETNPRYAMAYRGLALTYKAMENDEAAVFYLEKAIDLAPGFALAYLELGRAQADRFNFQAAMAAFKRVVELAPHSSLAEKAWVEIKRLRDLGFRE